MAGGMVSTPETVSANAVTALAISANDQLVATATGDRRIRIWDLNRGHLRLEFPSEFTGDFDIGFAARAPRLSASGKDRVWRIWDTASGTLIETIRLPSRMREYRMAAATADNGRALLRRGIDVDVYEATRPVRVLRGHTEEVLAEAISANGEIGVTGSRDSTARVWRVATGELVRVLPVADGAVVDVDISQEASMAVTASGLTVRVWDLGTGVVRSELKGHTGDLCCVVLTHDGRTVLSGSRDGTVVFWSVEDGAVVRRIAVAGARH